MKNAGAWQEIALPRWAQRRWTWRNIFLLAVSVFLFVDSFLVPISRDVDPGRSGEGIIFLIVAFRAVSSSELPISVLVMGTCLAALASSMNHRMLKSPSLIWTSIGIVLMVS